MVIWNRRLVFFVPVSIDNTSEQAIILPLVLNSSLIIPLCHLTLYFTYKCQGDRNCPLKIQIYLNCPGLRSSLEGISLVPTISDGRLLVYYKLRPPLIGLRRISYYEAVYNPGRKNVIFRPSMTIWGRSFLLQIILMGCWTHIKQEPSNHSLALPPNAPCPPIMPNSLSES